MVKGDNAHALGRTALNEVGDGPLVIIAGGGEPVHKDKGLFYPPWGSSALVTSFPKIKKSRKKLEKKIRAQGGLFYK